MGLRARIVAPLAERKHGVASIAVLEFRSISMPQPNPHLNPILQQASALTSQQRRRLREIAFWFLFGYLEIDVFELAARDLLVALAVAAIAAALFRQTQLGRRVSFVALHLAILTSMTLQLVRQPSASLGVDALALAALAALELSNRKLMLLVLIGGEHLGALLFSPWSLLGAASGSTVVSAHVVARVLAAGLVFAIAGRAWLTERASSDQQSAEPASRPVTVAEWEAREASRPVVGRPR